MDVVVFRVPTQTARDANQGAIPLIRPSPPCLSGMVAELKALEASGTFTNNGACVRRFEADATARLFGGTGGCVTVANATLGLMLALRLSAAQAAPDARLALMPAFTFAAQAHASLWAGLTPLFCDIDEDDWAACPRAEEASLKRHRGRIAVIVPYATFGNSIDLDRYEWLSRRHSVDVVIDAAASLGSRNAAGQGFATGSRLTSVFSMHATKVFATAEGGLIYSADKTRLASLRSMANFGFGEDRSAQMPGMNAKMSELHALLALAKLGEIETVVQHRAELAERYRANLPSLQVQRPLGQVQALQSMPMLLPRNVAAHRPAILAALARQGVGAATYFSPHLAEQAYFRSVCRRGRLPVTGDVAGRVMSLPLSDGMSLPEVDRVCDALSDVLSEIAERPHHARSRPAQDDNACARL